MERLGQIAQRILQEAAQKAGKSLPQCVCVAAGGEDRVDLQPSPPQVRRSGKGAGEAREDEKASPAIGRAWEEHSSRIEKSAVEAVASADNAASTASG